MGNQRVRAYEIAKNSLKSDEGEYRQKRLKESYLKLIDNLRERRAYCEKVRPNEEGIATTVCFTVNSEQPAMNRAEIIFIDLGDLSTAFLNVCLRRIFLKRW